MKMRGNREEFLGCVISGEYGQITCLLEVGNGTERNSTMYASYTIKILRSCHL